MVTPWSTNARITQNMGISGIIRIEEFKAVAAEFLILIVLSQSIAHLIKIFYHQYVRSNFRN
jgi:phosphoribosylformylglycinamidine synthase